MPVAGGPSQPDNILLIILDTVRARSSYPANPRLTPTIADVGSAGACFHHAITPAPWTLPAHASMFTGRYPTEHGVTTYETRLDSFQPTLAQHLADTGRKTGLFSSNAWVSETYGLDRGFEVHELSQSDYFKLFDDGIDFFLRFHAEDAGFRRVATDSIIENPSPKNVANLLYVLYKEFFRHVVNTGITDLSPRWDEHTVEACRAFIRENAANDVGFFAVVNLIQAHSPWIYDIQRLQSIGVTPSAVADDETWEDIAENSDAQGDLAAGDIQFDETERSILTSLYNSWVHSVDTLAGKIVHTLDTENVRENTLLLITSDHGESIARDDILGHSVALHSDVTHVPLVMDGPGVPNVDINEIVSLKDIFGTILSSVDIEPHSPSLFDDEGTGVALSETDGGDAFEDKEKLAKRFGKRRAIFTEERRAEIHYDSDETVGPEELIEQLDSIIGELEERSASTHEEAEVGEAVKFQLRELGYME